MAVEDEAACTADLRLVLAVEGTETVKKTMLLAFFLALPSSSPFRNLPNGVRGWSDDVDCPCADPALCEPIAQPRAREDVYAFHIGGNASWRGYDWSQYQKADALEQLPPSSLASRAEQRRRQQRRRRPSQPWGSGRRSRILQL
jgi:hypothetical protein